MKKILLPLTAFAFCLVACNTPKYTINGTVEGTQTGDVYLIKYQNRTADTLAKAPIQDGKFVLSGNAEKLTDAYIMVKGTRSRTPIFLENMTYTVNLNPTKPYENKIEGGGEAQALANQYIAIENEYNQGQSKLYQEYAAAAQQKDTAKMAEIRSQYDEMSKNAMAKEEALTKANPDSYVAAYMLATGMGGMDVEELNKKYEELGANAKASEPGQKIADRITKLKSVAIGQIAPDFTLNTPEGKPLSMHSIKGKAKIIDFWASWCGPCRGENPNVVKVYEEFHPKGLEILSVSLDNNKEAWLKAIKDDNLNWNHVSDLQGWSSSAAELYGVNGIPHILLLDENNKIIAKNLRGQALKEKIAEILN